MLPSSAKSKRSLIEPDHAELSVRRQCALLGLYRSSMYYDSAPESDENLGLMRLIDEQYTKCPFYGSRRIAAWLRSTGHEARTGLKELKENEGVKSASAWTMGMLPGMGVADRFTEGQASKLAGGIVVDTVLDMAAAVPAYAGMKLEVTRLRLEGRFVAAEKAKAAGTLGIISGSTPAQMLMAAAESDNRFVKTYMSLNPHLRGLAHALKASDALGRKLDAAQFERGADSAALVEQVVMLPLDMIGVGEVAHASMAALRATTRVATKAVKAVVPKVVRETAHAAAHPFVKAGVHKVAARFGDDVHARATAWAKRNGWEACFPANTMMVGEFGLKPIEAHRSFEECGDECDRIWSRNEHDPDGPLVLRRVLRRFDRLSQILNLHVGAKLIGTTAEHPFFVRDRGWTPAQELRIGDEIRLMGPGFVRVDGVADSGRIETVYNLEIEGDHTYFVGCDEWGFAVWAHNAYRVVESGDGKIRVFDGKKLLLAETPEQLAKVAARPGSGVDLPQPRTALSNAGIKVDVPLLASELPVVRQGTKAWADAVEQVRGSAGRGVDVRVDNIRDAKQLLREARGNMDVRKRYTTDNYAKGFEVHPSEAASANTPWNNLMHVKWKVGDDGGHIFFSKTHGPREPVHRVQW